MLELKLACGPSAVHAVAVKRALFFTSALLVAGSGWWNAALWAGETALTVVRAGAEESLLQNGGFEIPATVGATNWQGWHEGYRVSATEGRGGSRAVTCERGETSGEQGAGQTLNLNRTQVAPLVISGWSKAQDVSGTPDNGYSLYADVIYADGTSWWAQTANFSCGTHDWERREWVLLPEKPIRSITLHCLFRGHTGKVWFDDVAMGERKLPQGATLYQGVPVEAPAPDRAAPRTGKPVASGDGLELRWRGEAVNELKVDGRAFKASAPGGFSARDAAHQSDFRAFMKGTCDDLKLRLQVKCEPRETHLAVSGQLLDSTGTNRAITLVFALPIDATGWRWGDDVRQSRAIAGSGEFMNTVGVASGANGKVSKYPLAAIWDQRSGLALGLDMEHPAQYRLVYHPVTRQFLIAYDFGLAPETSQPGTAEFSFVIFRFDPQWGFRAAWDKYCRIFPGHFTKRVPREGTWMPFTDIAKVPGHEDFGFAFQEGAPNVAFDDAHGILSFVYVEPASHWLPMPPEAPRTYDGALTVLRSDATGARGPERRQMAEATFSSVIARADTRFALHLEKAPWCDGGVFLLNPQPGIPTNSAAPWSKAAVMHHAIAEAFARNAPKSPGGPEAGLDGVYFDSLEMAGEELDYRRDHFRAAAAPLVFDAEARPCQWLMLATWDFVRTVAADQHRERKLTFANGALWKYNFPAPLLDVLGTEVNWLPQGRWEPDSDAVMNFRRALCGQKPYCLLMNTDFSKFDHSRVEQYFQRCLFYGMWPGFFDEAAASKDPYWVSPRKYYERDRDLFRKYIPLLRATAAAGWQPITHAATDNLALFVERFGPSASGELLISVLNSTGQPQSGTLSVDWKELGWSPISNGLELVSGISQGGTNGCWRLTLEPGTSQLWRFRQ